MEVAHKKRYNSTIKRKRLNARTFRQWHMSQAKKHKVFNSTTPERKKSKLKESTDDKLEVHCSKESDSKKQRINSEVKPHADNGEAISSVLEGFEQASVSTNTLLHEITHGEMLEDGALGGIGAKELSQDLSDCNSNLPRYVEYWVPVGLSYVQLEKYCETLLKKSTLLCSNLKKGILDDLDDILTTIRKCCDHPYLVDSSLQKFVNEGHPVGNCLSNDIKVSGKFLLLHKLLQEVKEKQLRVLIVFQSNDSKLHSVKLQHILDDLICANVGEDCYIQIYREFDSTKKRAAVDLFNDRKSGKLVMLMEKSSCQPSIKLSSVDCVILFNSDWSPTHDIKSLRKMSIQSKFDHLKVFRLYSSKSVEEKALILAKKGAALECNSNTFSHSVNHMLLLWGTSYLFSKLDEFHSQCSSIANLNFLSEDKLVLDVLNELLALLSCPESNNMSCSLISKVQEVNDDYSRDIALHGEQDEPIRDDDLPPITVWASLLEGRNPQWKLLPSSSERRRRGKLSARTSQYVEFKNEDSKVLSKKTHIRDKSFCSKLKVKKVCRSSPGKRAGHPKSRDSAVKLSSCREDYNSPSQIENTCIRRMRELILKQKKVIREFYRTKREERDKLEEEHKLKLDLINQRYRETALKQEKLKMLDLIYEQKLEEHNHQMDTKRNELEDEHSASRIKEKQLKDKLFALLKTENLGTPTTSLVKLSFLEAALGQQTVDLIENSVVSTIMISETTVVESKHSHEIELGMMNTSAQCDDPECPDQVLTETDILLSVKSNEENDAVSMRTEEVPNTRKANDIIPVPANRASTSIPLCENQCQATLQASNRDIEGDSSRNMESSKEIMHGMTPMCPVRGSLESDGENDVAVVPSGEVLYTYTEVLNRGSNLCTSEEAQLHTSSGNSYAESLSNFPHKEVQEQECNVEALVGATNAEAEIGGTADLGTIVPAAWRQRIEQLQDEHCNTEAAVMVSSGEAEMSGAADLGTTGTVGMQQTIEELPDLPPFRLNGGSQVLVQPQTCLRVGNSSQLEQLMVSANSSCNEIRQSPGASGVSNCQNFRVLAQGQTQMPLRNLELCDHPVVQTQWQYAGWEQPHFSNSGAAANMQPVNSYLQGSSILRYNLRPYAASDPLQNELVSMKKEEEKVIKIHEDKMIRFKSACEKDIQEIHKKYDLLLREADNTLVQKKLELESDYKKVYAHKLLADSLKYTNQKQTTSSMPPEALLSAVLQFVPRQFNLPPQRPLVASGEPSAPPVQVVHQLSELVPFDATRPKNCSTLYNAGNPLAGYYARSSAPHLRPPRPVTSSVWPHGSLLQDYGAPQNTPL